MDDQIKELFVALGTNVLKHSQLIEQQNLILKRFDHQFKEHENKLSQHSLVLEKHENRLLTIQNKIESKGKLDQSKRPEAVNQKGEIIWALNSKDQIFYRESNNHRWNKIDGRLVRLSVGKDGRLWGVNSADQIYTRTGIYGSWQLIAGSLVDISAHENGEVWGINRQKDVFIRYQISGGWTKVPSRPFPKRNEPNVQWISD